MICTFGNGFHALQCHARQIHEAANETKCEADPEQNGQITQMQHLYPMTNSTKIHHQHLMTNPTKIHQQTSNVISHINTSPTFNDKSHINSTPAFTNHSWSCLADKKQTLISLSTTEHVKVGAERKKRNSKLYIIEYAFTSPSSSSSALPKGVDVHGSPHISVPVVLSLVFLHSIALNHLASLHYICVSFLWSF